MGFRGLGIGRPENMSKHAEEEEAILPLSSKKLHLPKVFDIPTKSRGPHPPPPGFGSPEHCTSC